MRLTELAIKRPAMVSMLFLLFIFLGIMNLPRIPVDLYPAVNIPYVSVTQVYSGASPAEVEEQLIKPIEDEILSLNGVKTVSSTASDGMAVVVIEFSMNVNLEEAANDVQRAIDGIKSSLPDEANEPVVKKFDFNSEAILTLALGGNKPLDELTDLANNRISDRLQRIPGVGQVTISGGRERELRIEVNKEKLEAYNLPLTTVISRIAASNLNVPAGRVEQRENEYLVRMLGKFSDVNDINNVAITLPTGGQVQVKDLATVDYGYKEMRSYSRLQGKDAVAIQIQKQSTASTVSIVESIKKELPGLRASLPEGVELQIARDNSSHVKLVIKETWKNMIEGIIFTALVLLLFLREWRSTVIVLIAIPTSLIATLIMLYVAGFSFNILTLLGLIMCIGILVDDSIVVLENIHRHRIMLGKDPASAALDGRIEIGMAAVAITLSDVAVFAPIALMTGLVGQFFKQFGLTVVFATLFSLLISFTITPMMASRLFKKESTGTKTDAPSQGRWQAKQEEFKNKYQSALRWALNHRKFIMVTCLILPMAVFSLLPLRVIQTEFLPRSDENRVAVSLEMPPGTSLAKTDRAISVLEKRAMNLPETSSVFATIGQSGERYMGSKTAQYGNLVINLVSRDERSRSLEDIGKEIRQWRHDIPGAKISILESSGIKPEMSPIQINITSNNNESLQKIAKKVENIVRNTSGATDINNSWAIGQPEIQATVNSKASDYFGVTKKDIAGTLRYAISGDIATKMSNQGEETDIRVLIEDADHYDVRQLKDLGIMNSQGQIIPLGDVAELKESIGPAEIKRMNGQRLITIKSDVSGRPLGEVTRDIQKGISDLQIPSDVKVSFWGEMQDLTDSFAELLRALILSIVFVYAILVMLYESYLVPFIRMLSLPLGMVGAFLALALTGQTLNVISFIGLIMLDGLVAKNSTLLIDYTHTIMKREEISLREALIKAGTTRLRPIVMTTVTMIAGMLPAALFKTAGSELRSGMAIALIGGLILSTLLTLLVVPVAYTLLDDLRNRIRGHRTAREETI